MAINQLIEKDKRVRRLLKQIEQGRYRFDTEKYVKEIRQLHINWQGRDIGVSDVIHRFQSKFLGAVLHAQANRTRIVQIKMLGFIIHAKLDKHTKLVKKHLKANFTQPLNRMAGTAADRESVLDSILEPAFDHLSDIKMMMDIADMAIDDLDKNGWTHKNVIKIMEQIGERKAPKV